MSILGRHSLERAGVRRVLEDDGRVRIVGEGAVDQASHMVRSTRPDVLIASHQNTDEALNALRTDQLAGPARIVLVSRLTEDSTRMLLRLGACGVLLLGDCVEHLPWAVRATAAGSVALAPAAARFVVDQYVRPGQLADEVTNARELLTSLSAREREILEFVGRGASNSTVAETLNISAHTVKDHVRAIYTKLLVSNRVQAARILWQARSQPGPTPPRPVREHARGTPGHHEHAARQAQVPQPGAAPDPLGLRRTWVPGSHRRD
nr:response regulator transcription factor [Streptomyces chartreusis]